MYHPRICASYYLSLTKQSQYLLLSPSFCVTLHKNQKKIGRRASVQISSFGPPDPHSTRKEGNDQENECKKEQERKYYQKQRKMRQLPSCAVAFFFLRLAASKLLPFCSLPCPQKIKIKIAAFSRFCFFPFTQVISIPKFSYETRTSW